MLFLTDLQCKIIFKLYSLALQRLIPQSGWRAASLARQKPCIDLTPWKDGCAACQAFSRSVDLADSEVLAA